MRLLLNMQIPIRYTDPHPGMQIPIIVGMEPEAMLRLYIGGAVEARLDRTRCLLVGSLTGIS